MADLTRKQAEAQLQKLLQEAERVQKVFSAFESKIQTLQKVTYLDSAGIRNWEDIRQPLFLADGGAKAEDKAKEIAHMMAKLKEQIKMSHWFTKKG